MKTKSIVLVLALASLFGCQEAPKEEAEPTAAAQPQIRKIPISDRTLADSLRRAGLDVLVVEDDYVVVRLQPTEMQRVQQMNLPIEPLSEQELVQRLVKIPVTGKADVDKLVNLGLDVWEVRGDTVVAQVFDKHIFEAEKLGFRVQIVERDVRNLAKREARK